MKESSEYEKQGIDFLEKAVVKMEVKLLGHFPFFDDDKDARDVYLITFTRKDGRKWSFRFGQSINNSMTEERKRLMDNMTFNEKIKEKKKVIPPSAYDVLSCIEHHDPGTFEDFCGNFGYDTDSRKAEKIYFAVQKEARECEKMFASFLDELDEIQ